MRFMPKRRWFRFSLRTLLVLTAVVAVALGVVGYHVRWIQQRRAFLANGAAEAYQGNLKPGPPAWLSLLGEDGHEWVVLQSNAASLETRAQQLFPESKVLVLVKSRKQQDTDGASSTD